MNLMLIQMSCRRICVNVMFDLKRTWLHSFYTVNALSMREERGTAPFFRKRAAPQDL